MRVNHCWIFQKKIIETLIFCLGFLRLSFYIAACVVYFKDIDHDRCSVNKKLM